MDSSLLSILESSKDGSLIVLEFENRLYPIIARAPLPNPEDDLFFLDNSISILNYRLKSREPELPLEHLIEIYDLCVKCSVWISQQLDPSYDPTHMMHQFMACLVMCKSYSRAEEVGVDILKCLRGSRENTTFTHSPEVSMLNESQKERVGCVFESIISCAAVRKGKDINCPRLLSIVKDANKWFRESTNPDQDMLILFMQHLGLFTHFMVGDLNGHSTSEVHSFLEISLEMHQEFCRPVLYLYVRKLWGRLCFHDDGTSLEILPLLRYILDFIISAAQGNCTNERMDFQHIQFLYDTMDSLSLKGSKEFYGKICQEIVRVYRKIAIPDNEIIQLLWATRRLSHALCIGPMCDEMFSELSVSFDDQLQHTDFWINCLHSSKHSSKHVLMGFKQIYSNLFAEISHDSDEDFAISVSVVKGAASELSQEQSTSFDTSFSVGCLYYDLSEKLIATGNLLEALDCAVKASELRTLLLEGFVTIHDLLRKPFTTELLLSSSELWNEEKPYLSKMKLLQCYLESTLQMGTIHEKIGNGMEAEVYLLQGRSISQKQNLSLFRVAFSSVLGKLYRKNQSWEHSRMELEQARLSLGRNILSSCVKSELTLQVSVDMQISELYRILDFHNNPIEGLDDATSLHRISYEKLTSKWSCSHLEVAEDGPKCKRQKVISECDICEGMKCWLCLALDVKRSKSLLSYIGLQWEILRRRLCLWVLKHQGKLITEDNGLHENIMERVRVLICQNPFTQPCSSDPSNLVKLVAEKFRVQVFSIECARLIYNICLFSLKNLGETRIGVQLSQIIPYLKTSFVFCCEAPMVQQKVSRLIAVMYVLSSSMPSFSLPSDLEELSEAHWGSFFHQASVGMHITNWMRCKGSIMTGAKSHSSPRHVEDLELSVKGLFSILPNPSIICISILGGKCAALLAKLSGCRSTARAWMLLSRLNQRSPLVMLRPLDKVLEGFVEFPKRDVSAGVPRKFSVIDEVAPEFKCILEKIEHDTKPNYGKLDDQLGCLIRKLEVSLLGTWRYVILGGLPDSRHTNYIGDLMRHLKSEFKVDVSESHLRYFLGGGKYTPVRAAAISTLLSVRKDCFIANNEELGNLPLSDSTENMISNAVRELESEFVDRKPVILVLDSDMQMIPWEAFDVLRDQEVYRMPSVGSILLAFDKHKPSPQIDARDAFYLVNASEDKNMKEPEAAWKEFFEEHKIQGISGRAPTKEEISSALRERDLYIYMDHGCGMKYII